MTTNLVSLDMIGHIGDVFTTGTATRRAHTGGAYVNGRWVEGTTTETTHTINDQPLTMKQIDNLQLGGERVLNYRQVWVNDGVLASITEADTWVLPNHTGVFKTTRLDNRPTRNYCKFIAVRVDE